MLGMDIVAPRKFSFHENMSFRFIVVSSLTCHGFAIFFFFTSRGNFLGGVYDNFPGGRNKNEWAKYQITGHYLSGSSRNIRAEISLDNFHYIPAGPLFVFLHWFIH